MSTIPVSGPGAVFSFALVGSGPSLGILAGVLCREEFPLAFPDIKCVGRVPGPEESVGDSQQYKHFPVYADCKSLFAANPDITVACDLSADGSGMAELQRHAPPSTTLACGNAVFAFCRAALHGSGTIGGSAKKQCTQDILSNLLDQVDEEIVVLDLASRIVDMNRRILERKGGDKADYLGMLCHELDDGAYCNHLECPYQEVLRTGRTVAKTSAKVTGDGRMQYYRVRALRISDGHGNPWRVILLRNNATEGVQMENQLQQTEKMAVIGELSTYIAHEIRNPLFAIGGFASSLLRTPSLDEAVRSKVRIIMEESRRLDEILKSFINFSRQTEHTVDDVDINDVVRQSLVLLDMANRKPPVATTLCIDESVPKVRGNAEMFTECLINLLKNSHEALPQGGKITISTCMEEGKVQVAVSDNGAGIPAELQEKVFSPFFSTKDKGAGLGLAMTKKIVEDLGGSVKLSSQIHVGTTVTIALVPALAV